MLERPSRRPRSRGGRQSPVLRALLVTVALVLAFLVGLAFARTLDDRPEDGAMVTSVRTLTPRPQDAPAVTVTVTVTAP